MTRLPAWSVLFSLMLSCSPETQLSRVQTQLEALFEIPTVEMVFRDVVYHRSNQTALGLFSYDSRETLFRVLVRVQAGFDLSSGNFFVAREANRIIIHLPKPQILMADADDESLYEYFSRGNNIGLKFLQERKTERVEAAKAQALKNGILGEASRQARLRVSEILTALNVEHWDLKIDGVSGAAP